MTYHRGESDAVHHEQRSELPCFGRYAGRRAGAGPAADLGARQEALIKLVTDGLPRLGSKRVYRRYLSDFMSWCAAGQRPFTKATVQEYRSQLESRGLSSASVNHAVCCCRRLAAEASDNDMLDVQVAGAIGRVKGVKVQGRRIGNWLSKAQVEALLWAPDSNRLKGKRDRALLAVLIGCGLRRAELAPLTFEHTQQREARWLIADLVGRGRKVRSVPMPAGVKLLLDLWAPRPAFPKGRIFRSVNKGGRVVGESLTPEGIFGAVRQYTRMSIEGARDRAP